jgi:hypothetical protein
MIIIKKALIILAVLVLLADSSCNTKRDCRGRIKHKLPNGVWM